VSAVDDPFLPASVLPRVRDAVSPAVDFIITERGGHVGFIGGPVPWRCDYWGEELVVRWLAGRGAARPDFASAHDAEVALAR
jgi:predicted alpha/beta-fold hydrolase